jgi:multisubunit Na+/H+ antiporter MnhB subunit
MGFAPLKTSFMVASIIGFLVSAIWIAKYWPSYGFAFALVFTLMFVASMVSMTYASVSEKESKNE